MMESHDDVSGLDSHGEFFFPSSPLFGALSPNSAAASSGEDTEHNYEAELMFVHQNQQHFNNGAINHKQNLHQQQQQLQSTDLMLPDPFQSAPVLSNYQHTQQQQALMDWQVQNAFLQQQALQQQQLQLQQQQHLVQQQVQALSYVSRRTGSASSNSSSGGSGHSTPTLVASPVPTSHKREQSTVVATLAAAAAVVAVAPPSLLDQLSCTIPEVAPSSSSIGSAGSPGGLFLLTGTSTTTPPTKPKREKKNTAAAAAKKAEKLLAQQQQAFDLPVFVGAAEMHSSAAFGVAAAANTPASATTPAATAVVATVDVSAAAAALENNEPHPLDDEETKKRKLARKAELARLSRKRKKTRLSDLEAEVRRLEDELQRAKKSKLDAQEASQQAAAMHQADLDADALAHHKMNQVISAMSLAVARGLAQPTPASTPVSLPSITSNGQSTHRSVPILSGADAPSRAHPTELTPLIDEFMREYNAQVNNCARHLQTLQEHHVKPMRTFEFLNALMKQGHESPSSPSWSSLVISELALSPSCRELCELEGFRTSSVGQHNFDGEIERAFTKLSALCQKRATQQSKNLNRIRSIFNEAQFVKYIEWSHRRLKVAPTAAPSVAAAAAAAAASSYSQPSPFEDTRIKLE